MKITYLNHSGFLVELEEVCYLFDYYKGDLSCLEKKKPLFVFVSHAHEDHYNREIWNIGKEVQDVTYIISKDIPFSKKVQEHLKISGLVEDGKVFRVGENTEIKINENCKIRTLRSTDIGVAFIVEGYGKKIYHAGDLHLWLWKEESEEFNKEMEQNYKREIDSIKGEHFDVGFLPLDGRQEDLCYEGMDYFLKYVIVDLVIPMHLWGNYSLIDKYKTRNKKNTIIKLESEGQTYEI
ncbi:MAG: MBL fold metallo-hydrolase [Lachnospiraceae bacterium]